MSTDDINSSHQTNRRFSACHQLDATVPDLMAQQKPAHPVLTIVMVHRLVKL